MLRRLLVTWAHLRSSFAAQPRVEHSWTTVVEKLYEDVPPMDCAFIPPQPPSGWEPALADPQTRVPGAGLSRSHGGTLLSDEHRLLNMTLSSASRRHKSLKSQQQSSEVAMDFFMDRLRLSKKEFFELAKHNVKIRRLKDLKKVEEKLETLQAAGIDLKDITEFSQVLTNVSASTLKKRISAMEDVGYIHPLPLNILAASKARFTQMLEKFAKGSSPQHEEASKREFLEKIREKRIRMSYPGRNLRALKLREKIAFLEARGYAFEDIVAHQVVGLPVSKMAATLDELARYGLDPGDGEGGTGGVSLSMLFLFARYRRINAVHKASLGPIACILGEGEGEGESKDLLATAPTHLRRCFTLQRTAAYVANLHRLRSAGFSPQAVKAVPLLLCHHPAVLERHLEGLRGREELRVAGVEGVGIEGKGEGAGLVWVDVEKKEAGPKGVEFKGAKSKGAGPEGAGPKGVESKWAGPKGEEPKESGPEKVEHKKPGLVWSGPTEQDSYEHMEPALLPQLEPAEEGLWAKGILADEVKLLNALQFFIEREMNFQQPVIIHDGKESTDYESELAAKSEQCVSVKDNTEDSQESQRDVEEDNLDDDDRLPVDQNSEHMTGDKIKEL